MKSHDEFWSCVAIGGPHACWPWTGAIKGGGYGSLNWRGRSLAAHRVALSIALSAPLGRPCALHHCDVRACCNPLHLYWGTYADNNADRARRGRNNSALRAGRRNGAHTCPGSVLRGEACGSAKLSDADVLRIRGEHMRPCDVVRSFGISPSQAKRIVLGQSRRLPAVAP